MPYGYVGQQVPFDSSSGFSGQWVFGPTRIDYVTGDISHDEGDGLIFGFTNGSSGFSGFSGFSGSSGHTGTSGFSGEIGNSGISGFSGSGSANIDDVIRRIWMRF